jgi:hypothetical protein
MKFLLRVLLVVAGLIVALSLLFVMIVLLGVWGVRALWCKLTGQPVNPFAMRMNPRAGFEQVFRQAGRGSEPSESDRSDKPSKPPRRVVEDVTDVEPKR